jgi:hypothetical protein
VLIYLLAGTLRVEPETDAERTALDLLVVNLKWLPDVRAVTPPISIPGGKAEQWFGVAAIGPDDQPLRDLPDIEDPPW